MLKIVISISVFSTPMPLFGHKYPRLLFKKKTEKNMKLHIGYPQNMFRRRGKPYITYLQAFNKVIEFYDSKKLRLLPIFTSWISKKNISTPWTSHRCTCYFFEVGHCNQHLCKVSCFYHNLHHTLKIRY